MKHFIKHIKQYVFRGVLALIPIGLAIFIIRLIYLFIDKKLVELIHHYIGYRFPGMGLVLFCIVLYLVGLIASNVIGKKFFSIVDGITSKIPIINTAYQVGKQVSETLSLPEKQAFQRVVLVDVFKPKSWSIGFVTGQTKLAHNKEKLLKVFVPTVPNPTTGFLVMLSEKQVLSTPMSIEEGMKMVVSAGIIGPKEIEISKKIKSIKAQ